ncbi:MAG TPA: oligosaccharide flippase family protein [Candidatus Binataceae bacterium]|nr:oligosaccharide flippase family protein [Candidatus Binataceae bacterium]
MKADEKSLQPDLHHRSQEGSVWASFARSVRNNAMAEIGVQAIRISAMIILARQLAPSDFGAFRVLLIVGLIGILVYEAGIPDALIRLKDLRREHEVTAWSVSIVLAIASAGLLWFGAPFVATWMRMPTLRIGIRLLCIPILLEGTVAISNARLQRTFRYGVLALADLLGEVAFLGVGVAVALGSLKEWSLPAALACRLLIHAITVWIAEPRPPIGWPTASAFRELASFASAVSGGQLVYLLSSNADFLLVGRLLGSAALGFYVIAWDLLRFIPDRLNQVAGRVTYPAFCRFQDDNNELARAYLGFFEHIARIVLPILIVVVVAAPELVFTVYGRQWLPAAGPLRLLAGGLTLAGLRVGIGSLFYTKGYPSIDIYLHTLRLVLIIVVVTLCAPFGLVAVSAGMSGVEGVISIVGIWTASYLIELNPLRLLAAAGPGVRLAMICGICAVLSKTVAVGAKLERPEVLIVVAAICALAYCSLEAQTLTRMFTAAFKGRSLEALDL